MKGCNSYTGDGRNATCPPCNTARNNPPPRGQRVGRGSGLQGWEGVTGRKWVARPVYCL